MPADSTSRHPWLNREAVCIAGYFAVTLLLGAALAPVLFWGAQTLVMLVVDFKWTQMPVLGYLHHHVGKADFSRVFNRAVLVAALVCLWPALKLLRVRWGELGLSRNPTPWRHLLLGFAVGAGFLLAMGAVYLACDVFIWKKSIAWGSVVRDSMLRAVGAGAIEELVFRGALLGLLLRAGSERGALLFLSTVFAAVHFLQAPNSTVIRDGVGWGTGFWLVGEIVRTFASASFILSEFATLWGVGFLLGWMRLRTRSLWLPIGLHAGWVFGIGLFAGIAKASKPVARDQWLPWIGDTLKSGLVPLGVLILTGAVLAWLVQPRNGQAAASQ